MKEKLFWLLCACLLVFLSSSHHELPVDRPGSIVTFCNLKTSSCFKFDTAASPYSKVQYKLLVSFSEYRVYSTKVRPYYNPLKAITQLLGF